MAAPLSLALTRPVPLLVTVPMRLNQGGPTMLFGGA